jgi:hypothetical protein
VKGYRYENPLTHRRPYLISVPETPFTGWNKDNNNTNNGEVNQDINAATIPRRYRTL